MNAEQISDLNERLEKADLELRILAAKAAYAMEGQRLTGKAEGVRLALSYLREYAPGIVSREHYQTDSTGVSYSVDPTRTMWPRCKCGAVVPDMDAHIAEVSA
ncbi:hypothetical protein [Mycolicibacterium bacteremicum]|uniref:Uncharacterized protein n=1 Tax=Mycolicibacterium bacteremicum TaxID=564198 RepID=A0A1W9YQQ9_MYCBA|nr:hypothetical protein [Mycolicibacterium bacteremicum]MCV7434834.1 hypothetical protein [Mycolicibacterium bacteremicum]ORA02130.1 hypothetical protein BST17_24785 [Mycolicibacterium bacteremicum]